MKRLYIFLLPVFCYWENPLFSAYQNEPKETPEKLIAEAKIQRHLLKQQKDAAKKIILTLEKSCSRWITAHYLLFLSAQQNMLQPRTRTHFATLLSVTKNRILYFYNRLEQAHAHLTQLRTWHQRVKHKRAALKLRLFQKKWEPKISTEPNETAQTQNA